jgi:hypothetical protein
LRKVRLEKIAGVVALTYLVIIPAGAFYAWKKIQEIEDDVAVMWDKLEMPEVNRPPLIDLQEVKERLFG